MSKIKFFIFLVIFSGLNSFSFSIENAIIPEIANVLVGGESPDYKAKMVVSSFRAGTAGGENIPDQMYFQLSGTITGENIYFPKRTTTIDTKFIGVTLKKKSMVYFDIYTCTAKGLLDQTVEGYRLGRRIPITGSVEIEYNKLTKVYNGFFNFTIPGNDQKYISDSSTPFEKMPTIGCSIQFKPWKNTIQSPSNKKIINLK